MTDYMLWSNDIENRFSPTSLTDTVDVDGFIATAVISAVTTNSDFRLSLWDAYKNLREKLLDGVEEPLCLSTTTQRDALTGIIPGTTIFNITTQEDETYNGTGWVASGGERGGLTYLPVYTGTTTDNTQTAIATITLDTTCSCLFTSEVIGETDDHETIGAFIIECTVKRVNGDDAEIVGGTTTTHSGKDTGAASWDADFTVSGGNLSVSVTGSNSTTVNWKCDVNYLKFS